MFSSYDGAKRQAKRLHQALEQSYILYPLNRCQNDIAKASGYRDWHGLREILRSSERPLDARLVGDRLLTILPEPCRKPARMWLDNALPVDWYDKTEGMPVSWYECVHLYRMAMGAVHRRKPSLIMPGSGEGQKLRQYLFYCPVLSMEGPLVFPTLDAEVLALNFPGTMRSLFGKYSAHPAFEREFQRLVDGGVFYWQGGSKNGGTLTIFPPSPAILLKHVQFMESSRREYDEEAGLAGDIETQRFRRKIQAVIMNNTPEMLAGRAGPLRLNQQRS